MIDGCHWNGVKSGGGINLIPGPVPMLARLERGCTTLSQYRVLHYDPG